VKLNGRLVEKLGGSRPVLAPDAEVIRALAGLLAETGLTEIEYAIGDCRIRVAREPATAARPANGHGRVVEAAAAAEPAAVAPGGPPPASNGADHPGTLASPMVGVAYLAPEPGAAPFVRVGDSVGKGQTLLIIEAMKVMNQIRAPHAGRLVRIFVADAAPVEYGAPLMLIE
jgi:acetyl-CoA carboxylase biotin carboxyl carrier protein